MSYQKLKTSSCKPRRKERGSIAYALPLFMCVMKYQNFDKSCDHTTCLRDRLNVLCGWFSNTMIVNIQNSVECLSINMGQSNCTYWCRRSQFKKNIVGVEVYVLLCTHWMGRTDCLVTDEPIEFEKQCTVEVQEFTDNHRSF
jgi:hypothetical protein